MVRQPFSLLFTVGLLFTCSMGQERPGQPRPGQAQPVEPRAPRATEIQVVLVLPSGHPATVTARLDLLDTGDMSLQQAYTDRDGRGRLVVNRPGRYRIRATGPDIEDSYSEVFTLQRFTPFHSEMIQVKLKEPAGTRPAPPGSGLVSAASLNAPSDARKHYEKGNSALRERKWPKALENLQKAVEIHPPYDSAWNALGVAYMNTGEVHRGRECFEKAITLNEQNLEALHNMSKLFLNDRQSAQAESLLSRALAIDPRNSTTLMLMSLAQLAGGKINEAIASSRKAHSEPHEGQEVVHMIAARALESRKLLEEAYAEYSMYLKEAPSGPHAEAARQAIARLDSASATAAQPN